MLNNLLYNQDIFKLCSYINGQWLTTSKAKESQFDVFDPSQQKCIAKLTNIDAEQTNFAIASAHIAQQTWQQSTVSYRRRLLKNWFALIKAHKTALAELITLENGKPFAESLIEVDYGNSYVDWFADEALRINGDILPASQDNQRIWVTKQPVGVVAAITPWNFPNAMITRKIAPAIAAGCAMILKPSEITPLSALALVGLAEKAGFPAGVFNVIISDNAAKVGQALTSATDIKKISFTGSTRVGKLLCQQAAATMKRTSMELGGNAPFIVCADADLDAAVSGVLTAKFRNTGQACTSANRLLVDESVFEQFLHKLISQVELLKVGNGFNADNHLGPLINQSAKQRIQQLIQEAVAKKAQLIYPQTPIVDESLFMTPHILTAVTSDMAIFNSEIFGPVIAITTFKSNEQAIALANQTRMGLAAYVYCHNIKHIHQYNDALACGMVAFNQGSLSNAMAPFGGINESGLGREGSQYGLADYLELKYTNLHY